MKNSEMIVYKDNFINKIKSFFKKIFSKNKEKISAESQSTINEEKSTFLTELEREEKNKKERLNKENVSNKNDFNYENLNKLSINRLKEIQEYYNNIIEENERKITKLKK